MSTRPLSSADRALFRAVQFRRHGDASGVAAIRAAVAEGGRVDAVDPSTGGTPLFAALGYGGWPEGVAVLLELGADPDHVDKDGRRADEVVAASHTSAWEAASAREIGALLAARRGGRR